MTEIGQRMPECHCLACGKPFDGATAIKPDDRPEPGDITLCLYCGHIMAFGDDLRVRQLTDAEMRQVAGDRRILMVQKVRGEVMSRRKP